MVAELERELETNPLLDNLRPRQTGALVVSLKPGAGVGQTLDVVKNLGGAGIAVRVAGENMGGPAPADGQVLFYEDLMTAFIDPPSPKAGSNMMMALNALDETVEVRPEVYLFSLQEFRDTAEATWGTGAVHALDSPYTGKDIKIAILDTGIDANHPDFVGRAIVTKSFVEGEGAEDGQGHGTHCAGTACGKGRTPGIQRYGVAEDATLYVGKVLNNAGYGAERFILDGMRWAVAEGCEIISMSLGSPVQPGQSYNTLYERIASAALENGTLILAAAGNDANRSFGVIAPVGSPANAPSILAVGAVDPLYKPCYFSNGGINPGGGEIDLVAPGAGIFSSVPRPQLYKTLDGTSMACPHVAGVAALWAESDPALRGRALWDALVKNARPLPYTVRDVGAGLVSAPKKVEMV